MLASGSETALFGTAAVTEVTLRSWFKTSLSFLQCCVHIFRYNRDSQHCIVIFFSVNTGNLFRIDKYDQLPVCVLEL